MGLPCSNGNRPNLLTNQLTVSQVAEWSTRQNVWRKIWKKQSHQMWYLQIRCWQIDHSANCPVRDL